MKFSNECGNKTINNLYFGFTANMEKIKNDDELKDFCN